MENSQINGESTDNLCSRTPISDSTANQRKTMEGNCDTQLQILEQFTETPQSVFQDHFLNCFGPVHIPMYQKGEPFEKLAIKMTAVENTERKIKKRILREGYGSILPKLCLVSIFYHAYLNNSSEPFKATNFTFRLDGAKITSALKMAVKTMKISEISQFLVHPDYVRRYTEVPPNSTILYVIELRHFMDFFIFFTFLGGVNILDFSEIYKSALALCSKGNDLYQKGLIREAIKEYNIAESKLEECQVKSDDDYKIQQKLLLRIRSNLVVAFTKIQEPRVTCLIYNRIHYMCRRIKLNVPAKVYFNHARSLRLLSHFECAEKQLQRAQRLEPYNLVIAKELIELNAKKKENYDREMALAKTIFKHIEITRELDDKDEITKEFKEYLTEYFNALNKDDKTMLYNLPNNLTATELAFIKQQTVRYGLELKCTKGCGVDLYIVIKPSRIPYNSGKS